MTTPDPSIDIDLMRAEDDGMIPANLEATRALMGATFAALPRDGLEAEMHSAGPSAQTVTDALA
jgi:hypothetical protein